MPLTSIGTVGCHLLALLADLVVMPMKLRQHNTPLLFAKCQRKGGRQEWAEV